MAARILNEHPLEVPARFPPRRLEAAIARRIDRRTAGHIDHLQVTVSNGRVILHGSTSSYYARELALASTLQVLGSHNPKLVDMYVQLDDETQNASTC